MLIESLQSSRLSGPIVFAFSSTLPTCASAECCKSGRAGERRAPSSCGVVLFGGLLMGAVVMGIETKVYQMIMRDQ